VTDEAIRLRLERIYQGVRGSQRRLWPQDRLVEDLQVDSLSGLELLVRVEDEFGIRLVDDERAGTVTTVGDLVALVAALLREGQTSGAAGDTGGGDGEVRR
jgi:acyl carrier protein